MVGSIPSLPPSTSTALAGIDHVWLLYSYLDAGEFDGYASLMDDDAVVRGIGPRDVDGRDDAVRMLRSRPPGVHTLDTVETDDGRVRVTGHHHGPTATVAFADVFALTDCGLIRSHRRRYSG